MASLRELPAVLQAVMAVAASPGVGCYECVPTLGVGCYECVPTLLPSFFSVIYFTGSNFFLQHLCEFVL
jgi:hypothetical protein